MKNYILLFILLFVAKTSAQQGELVGINRAVESHRLDKNSIIIDKETSKKITLAEYRKLWKQYPNSYTEMKEEDLYGNPISFYYIKSPRSLNENIIGKSIQIHRKDINDEEFDLSKIKGKNVLIILQLDLEFPMINVDLIKEAENLALKKEGFISVIISHTNYDNAKVFASEHNLKSIIIPNSINLISQKFKLSRYPMFLILNEEKNVESAVKYDYELEEELLKFE